MTDIETTLPAPSVSDETLRRTVQELAHPLSAHDASGYDPLLELIGDARIVLIGDASHGTHEFYRERALITRRLIEEDGFRMVALEMDWPEGLDVDDYLQGRLDSAERALDTFSNYPTWMWGNRDFLHFVQWARRFNDSLPLGEEKVHLYGIDVRNLAGAAHSLGRYLEDADPDLAARARPLLAKFEYFVSGLRDAYSKRDEEIGSERFGEEARQIHDLMAGASARLGGSVGYFRAMQAARVVLNGERFYEANARKARPEGWNIRDTHMMDSLDALLEKHPDTKVVIWMHNSHIGDYRYTGDNGGMVNIGQLVRERRPGQSVAVGFGTYSGTVTATLDWGEHPQHMAVPPARSDSYDGILHDAGLDRCLLLLSPIRDGGISRGLGEWRGQRAIGVVYNPAEQTHNFVPTQLAHRYDAYVFIDSTRALVPLREEESWQSPLTMDSYPSGY